MSNIDVLSGIVTEWAKPILDDVIKNVMGGNSAVQTANAWVKKFFPVSENYSIWNDLSFLAMPLVNMAVMPILANGVAKLGVSDEALPKYALEVSKALLDEAEKKGSVSLMERYTISVDDVRRLKSMIESNFNIG